MEAIVGFAMGKVLETATSLASQEVSRAWGLEAELQSLSESATMIQAVLCDTAQRPVREEAVRLWLKKLQTFAYDADDVLDEFTYEVLRLKVESLNGKKRKRDLFSLPESIRFRFTMSQKVKEINKSLERIKNEATGFGLRVGGSVDVTPHQFLENRETTSFLVDLKVIGRDDDVSMIVNLLVNSSNQEGLSVIPIVGMGGLGKTTFTQSVYKDDEIKKHFDARIWICVSENFEPKRILREFLESVNPGKSRMENMNAILENLQKELKGKRYLIVLDDVWSEDPQTWSILKSYASQINTTKGNSIIVTTRSESVASIMETIPMYHLGKLSEDDCWSIFKERAFANVNAPMMSDLEGIGRKLVKRCAGVPLAAKVLGSMMRSKREKDEWLFIQNNKIWYSAEYVNEVSRVLKLSFDHLPSPSLKQCFAYCSLFPKDSLITTDKLIQLWMAQGLLQHSRRSNLGMEDLGRSYFNILLANSLFQDARRDEYDNIFYCKMHDLVHDLAQEVSRDEILALEHHELNDKLEIRHLSLIYDAEKLKNIPDEGAGKVRTLFSKGYISGRSGRTLSNFTGLRVLNLEGALIKQLPNSIGNLKHLRYLDVSCTLIRRFPRSIGKLYNLQTLRVMDCCEFHTFPEELTKLISLRHICFSCDDLIAYCTDKMPVEMRRLTCLQTLPYFAVDQEPGRGIEELGCLKKLRGELMINNLEYVRDGEEARKANLQEKTNIYKLRFGWSNNSDGNENDEDVLEGLQPHPNLKSLEIRGFGGDKFPSWMMTMRVNTYGSNNLLPLNNLVEIKLDNCYKCKQIPMLGHLPCLRDLCIKKMNNVKCIGVGVEFYGYNNHDDGASSSIVGGSETRALFPALKRFTLSNMTNLVQWREAAGVAFPCLEELSLWDCDQLTIAPCHFSTLMKLEIHRVHSSTPLANISSNLTTLRSLTIDDVSDLTSLPERLLQNSIDLASLEIKSCPELMCVAPLVSGCCTSIRSLVILKCEKLNYLPDGLHTLIFLEELLIKECPNLASIPSIDGLKSLRKLEIIDCHRLTILPSGLQSCTSLENLTVECRNVIFIPEDLRELRSLSSLTIRGCGELRCLPAGLTCLTHLQILNIGGFWEKLHSFPNFELIGQLQQLRELRLYGWPNLKSLPDQLRYLTALTSLWIEDFDGVKALPEWLGSLSSLTVLNIWKCKNLKYLPKAMKRLTQLEDLMIVKCPLLEERCYMPTEWTKISHIPFFDIFQNEEKASGRYLDESYYAFLHESDDVSEESDDILLHESYESDDKSEESDDAFLHESDDVSEESDDVLLHESYESDDKSEESDDVPLDESYKTANDVLLDESDESAAGDS